MLSEEEKRELKEMAASAKLGEDFRLLEEVSREAQTQVTWVQYLDFLTTMSLFGALQAPPRPFAHYTNVRL